MADIPTRLDLYAVGRDYLVQRAKRLDPGQVDVEGSDANLFVGSQSVVADTVSQQLAYSVAKLTLDGAEGDDLDRWAFDRYGATRKGASPAVGTVRFARAAPGASGTVPAGTLLRTLANSQYITTTPASFGAGDLVSIADVRAVQAGKATQVGANAIRSFDKPGELFDKTLTVTNPLTTAGGEDAEEDDTFRERVRGFWSAARRGVLAAIELGALAVPGVVSAQAIEGLTGGGLPARVVNLYIADSSGVSSQALARKVLTELDDYRAGGITVVLSGSMPLIVSVELKLVFAAGVDTATLSANVRAAVVAFINSLPVNGALARTALGAVLERFRDDGLRPNNETIVAPAGDLVPPVGQSLRTTLADVTVTS